MICDTVATTRRCLPSPGSWRALTARALPVCLAVVLLVALGACARGPTPYVAADPAVAGSAGYTDQRIEDNRFRVSFAASARTPEALVEDYLLFRAAEVTLAEGFDWFRLDAATTEPRIAYYRTGILAPVFTTRIFVVRRVAEADTVPDLPVLAAKARGDLSPAGQAALIEVRGRRGGGKGARGGRVIRPVTGGGGRHARAHRRGAKGHHRGHRRARHGKGHTHRKHGHRHGYKTKSSVRFGFGFGYGYGYRYGLGYGYGVYPYGYGPPRPVVTRLEGEAEFRAFAGVKPADDPAAYDARAVVDAIGPRLPLPGEG